MGKKKDNIADTSQKDVPNVGRSTTDWRVKSSKKILPLTNCKSGQCDREKYLDILFLLERGNTLEKKYSNYLWVCSDSLSRQLE